MILARNSECLNTFPLARADADGAYFVAEVSGPERQRLRLCELGIMDGARVSVLSRSREGGLVVKVAGGRMALSRDLAEQILVRRTGRAPVGPSVRAARRQAVHEKGLA